MKLLMTAERYSLLGHILAMAFGLAGLLVVIPHPELIVSLSAVGQNIFQLSMAGGGVVYIILGAVAVAIYAYRQLGLYRWLTFMVPSVLLSLTSELLGTSTGFPFGAYGYLSGLGYKIAGLVPFTIPLSWFYMGFVCYILARAGLSRTNLPMIVQQIASVSAGAILLTAWDLVLDPAMSQTAVPFWQFQEVGEFFGMPYRNLSGWFGTGALFMTVAAVLWGNKPIELSRSQLNLPVVTYLVNFAFGAVITVCALDIRFLIPVCLSVLFGVVPAIVVWLIAAPSVATIESESVLEPNLTTAAKRAPEVVAK
jgi:uncharacterized membrane protein